MRIELDVSKNAQQNALSFFDRAKRIRQKIDGARDGMDKVRKKLGGLSETVLDKKKEPVSLRKKDWFEKFRWCFTRNGFLLVGGKDAHSNELLVKRHLEKGDRYFHADVHGAPHCVLKNGQSASAEDLEDASVFAGLFSSVWKKGFFSVKVYSVLPDQVSKKAPSGESLGRGSFMIYGKRDWFDPVLRAGLGVQKVKDGFRPVCGPFLAVSSFGELVREIVSGEHSKSSVAKSFVSFVSFKDKSISLSLDDVMGVLPNGLLSLK